MIETRSVRPHVLAYHEIAETPSGDVYCITPEVFLSQMWTARHAAQQKGQTLRITFDDGHMSHIRWAEPILSSLNIQGHFFIPTSWVGVRSAYASWNDLRTLSGLGHHIGSHGATHTFLSACNCASLLQEVRGSRLLLEDKIGKPVTSISMPGGRWNEDVILACALAGYEEVYTSEPGMYRPPASVSGIRMPAVIGRFAVLRKTSMRTVTDYAEGNLLTVNWLRSKYHLRQRARKLIGDKGYQQIWSALFRTMPS